MLSGVIEFYNTQLDFNSYWDKFIKPIHNLNKFPCKCLLHNETDGASFSYSSKAGIWSCFGKCKTGGKVVDFHYLYLKKDNPRITMMGALLSLHKMFPEYNLPYPTINTNSSYNPNDDLEEVRTTMLDQHLKLISTSRKSDILDIPSQASTNLNDKILSIFIERRYLK